MDVRGKSLSAIICWSTISRCWILEFCILGGILLNPSRFFSSEYVFFLTRSSENGRFERSPKLSTTKRRFSKLPRNLTFLSKLAFSLANPLWNLHSKVANDIVYRFRPMKPILLEDSRIFRIHILLNFEILFFEACRFQNSEGL